MFTLTKTYDTDHYDYNLIRCQRRNFNTQLKNVRYRFSNMVAILKLTYNPNSINLYNARTKETLREKITCEGNFFNIKMYLIEDVRKLYSIICIINLKGVYQTPFREVPPW